MSRSDMTSVARWIVIILILFGMGGIFGCKESQQVEQPPIFIDTSPTTNAFELPENIVEPPVWGKGELPADHQDFFGNDNTARLDYVQNKVLDKHAAILKIIAMRVLALEAVDPNAMRLEALESGMEKLMLVEAVE